MPKVDETRRHRSFRLTPKSKTEIDPDGLERRRISSDGTWWYKKGFPALWFGFLGIFTFIALWGPVRQQGSYFVLVVLLSFAVAGYFAAREYCFRLVDEVWIEKDELIVCNRGIEDRFPLTNLTKVTIRKRDIVLTLDEPCALGHEIAFVGDRIFSWSNSRWLPAEEQLRQAYLLSQK